MRVSATSSRHTGTTRCLEARVWNPASPGPSEPVPDGAVIDSVGSSRRRRGRSRCGCRCGTPRHPPGRRPPAARRRRSRSARSGRTDGRRRSRPCTRTPVGSGSRTRSVRSPGSWSDDSRFIQANMSTARIGGVLDDGRDQAVGVEGDLVQFVLAEVDGDGGKGRCRSGWGSRWCRRLSRWCSRAVLPDGLDSVPPRPGGGGGWLPTPPVRATAIGSTVTGTGPCRRRCGWRPRRGCPARAGSRTRRPGPRPRSGPRD